MFSLSNFIESIRTMFKEGGYVANLYSYSRGEPAIRLQAEFACTRPCVVSPCISGRRAPLNDMHTPVNFYLIGQFNSPAFAAVFFDLDLGVRLQNSRNTNSH